MLYWYLDDYIELQKSQKQLLDVNIEQWHDWHRNEELAQYRQQLVQLREALSEGPLDQQQWLAQTEMASQHWQRFRDHIVPDLAKLVPSLNDKQIESLFDALEKENLEELEESADLTDEERFKERLEGLQEQMKSYIGRLSDEQKAIIDDYAPRFQSTFADWIRYRRDIQAHAKALMLTAEDDPEFAQKFAQMMSNPDQFKSESYLTNSATNRQLFTEMVAKINTTVSAKQRKKFDKKLEDLIELIDDLIED